MVGRTYMILNIVIVACAVGTAALTAWVRSAALNAGMLDRPNERSSHVSPTPRGGGLSIVAVVTLATCVLAMPGLVSSQLLLAVLLPFLAIAVVGWQDDKGGLSVRLRLLVHVATAVWCVAWSGLAQVFGPALIFIVIFALVWAINLFNFMDGIDGIAASQGAFLGGAGVLLLWPRSGTGNVEMMAVTAGACLGFLVWNWSPARIFMGDIGSGALGFVLAAVPLVGTWRSKAEIWPWIILWGAFLVDASVTLARRIIRGAVIHQAHRTHAYQRLARRWNSHRSVVAVFVVINVMWLLPWAMWASSHPASGALAALAALSPLVALSIAAGAGTPE